MTKIVYVVIILGMSTVSFGLWALSLSGQVAALTVSATSTAVANRQALTKAITKAKAKARLRRIVVAVPVLGLAAVGYFEEQDYQEWLETNPEGDRTEYGCQIAKMTLEIADEVLQELPELIRPEEAKLKSWIAGEFECLPPE